MGGWVVDGDEWWRGQVPTPIAAAAASACITSAWQQQANDGYNMIQPKATQKLQVDSSWICIKRLLRCQGCIFKGLDVSSTEWSDNGTQQSIVPSQCTVRAPGIFINLQYSTVSWTPLQNASGSLLTQKIWVLFLRYWVALHGQMKMQSNILISPE